jgi:hypothetical protein
MTCPKCAGCMTPEAADIMMCLNCGKRVFEPLPPDLVDNLLAELPMYHKPGRRGTTCA